MRYVVASLVLLLASVCAHAQTQLCTVSYNFGGSIGTVTVNNSDCQTACGAVMSAGDGLYAGTRWKPNPGGFCDDWRPCTACAGGCTSSDPAHACAGGYGAGPGSISYTCPTGQTYDVAQGLCVNVTGNGGCAGQKGKVVQGCQGMGSNVDPATVSLSNSSYDRVQFNGCQYQGSATMAAVLANGDLYVCGNWTATGEQAQPGPVMTAGQNPSQTPSSPTSDPGGGSGAAGGGGTGGGFNTTDAANLAKTASNTQATLTAVDRVADAVRDVNGQIIQETAQLGSLIKGTTAAVNAEQSAVTGAIAGTTAAVNSASSNIRTGTDNTTAAVNSANSAIVNAINAKPVGGGLTAGQGTDLHNIAAGQCGAPGEPPCAIDEGSTAATTTSIGTTMGATKDSMSSEVGAVADSLKLDTAPGFVPSGGFWTPSFRSLLPGASCSYTMTLAFPRLSSFNVDFSVCSWGDYARAGLGWIFYAASLVFIWFTLFRK